jgi:nucleoside 2-deoxyribosyltransferase
MSTKTVMGGPAEPGPQPFRIYLAGGFHKDYKVLIQNALVDQVKPVGRFALVDPESAGVGYGPGEYVEKDFRAIRQSDLVLAFFDEYPYVYGVAAEIGYAVAMTTPVILVMERERVDSFLSGCARATFTKLNPALDFILARYGKAE